MKRATGRRSIVAQSRPSEDGEVNKHRARPNAPDPTTSFRLNEQTDQFSPKINMINANQAVIIDPFEDILLLPPRAGN